MAQATRESIQHSSQVHADVPGLTRRVALTLAAGTVAATTATALAASKALGADNPDAELLELGRQFDAIYAEQRPLELKANELGYWCRAQAWQNCRGSSRPWEVEGRPGIDELHRLQEVSGFEAVDERLNDVLEGFDPVMDEIAAMPARTVAGLAVKANEVAYRCRHMLWPDERWEEYEFFRALIESIWAAAGVTSTIPDDWCTIESARAEIWNACPEAFDCHHTAELAEAAS